MKTAKYNLELTVKVHEIPANELNRAIESISRLAEVCGDLESLHINVEPVFDTQAAAQSGLNLSNPPSQTRSPVLVTGLRSLYACFLLRRSDLRPASPAVPPRFSSCLLLRWCACPASVQLEPHCALSLLPIALAAPAPFSGVKLPTRIGSDGLPCGILLNRSKTR